MADDKLNTGTGGINIDGKVYSADVGVPDDQGGPMGDWSSGNVSVDKSVKDLSKPTRETFAKYLSKVTLAKEGSSTRQNAYPVGNATDGAATTVNPVSLNKDGIPTPPSPSPNESMFSKDFDLNVGVGNGTPFKKGFSTGPGIDGNDLLKSVGTKGVNSLAVENYVSSVLKTNRFNPIAANKRFAGDGYLKATSIKDVTNTSTFDANSALARPDQLSMGSSAGNDDSLAREYKFKRLAQIGTVVQLRSSVELNSDKNGYNPNSQTNQLAALLPGLGQLGSNVDSHGNPLSIELISIDNIIKNLTTESIKDEQLVDFGSTFQGTINNVYDKFSGFSSVGMLALAAALVAAIIVAFETISLGMSVFNTRVSGNGMKRAFDGSSGRPGIGSYSGAHVGFSGGNVIADLVSFFSPVGEGKTKGLRFFNLAPTRRAFPVAVMAGMTSFFGIEGVPPPGIQSPGQLVVIGRAIVRSVTEIVFAFKDLVDQFKSAGAFSNVTKVIEIIYIIRNSRFMGAMNVFAQLGDSKSLIVEGPDAGETANNVTISDLDAGLKISSIDAAKDDDRNARYGKSRLLNGTSSRLAWATNQAPSLHLLPAANWMFYKTDFGVPYGNPVASGMGGKDSPNRKTGYNKMEAGFVDSGVSRIAPVEVERLENELDSEYVPFYFHDLRTNEIIGFHAFLSSLTDDFQSQYESVDAFGRVEPIKVYKNTQRKIGLSFLVAALDDNDFDHMWMKINKLVTLMYPQYTAGQAINVNGDYNFTKPFTQQIGAAPMIRLRVGNLVSSNYSKFNLAGIFGLNDPAAYLNGRDANGNDPAQRKAAADGQKQKDAVDAAVFSTAAAAEKALEDLSTLSYTPGYLWTASDTDWDSDKDKKLNPKEFGLAAEIQGKQIEGAAVKYLVKFVKYIPSTPSSNKVAKEYAQKHAKYDAALRQKKVSDIANAIFKCDPGDLGNLTPESQAKLAAALPAAQARAAAAQTDANNARDAAGSASAIESPVTPDPTNPMGKYVDEVKTFLDEKNNAIVRSFKSAGGKGLAGFIESMNFDWYQGTTWDTDKNRLAPKMCKVTINFTPVHDISPGLDSNGYDRAPVYRVGPYRRP